MRDVNKINYSSISNIAAAACVVVALSGCSTNTHQTIQTTKAKENVSHYCGLLKTKQLEQDAISALNTSFELAHNQKAQYPHTTALQIEMLFSLFHQLMVPNHSAEIGKEFTLLYQAEKVSYSSSLNRIVDYRLFHAANNLNLKCDVNRQRMLLQVTQYFNLLDLHSRVLLRTYCPQLAHQLASLSMQVVAAVKET